jgi:alanyl-tRNA synthetase
MDAADSIAGASVVIAEIDLPASELSAVADVLRGKDQPVCGLLASKAGKKVAFVTFAHESLTPNPVHAGELAREIAGLLGGGGGGRPEFAQAGGKNPEALPGALDRAREILAGALEG